MATIPKINFETINQEVLEQLTKALTVNQNLVNTAAISTMNNFDRIASEAFIAVTSGKQSSDSAIRHAVNELVDRGVINVTYPSGRKINIASALSTNVRTTLKQTTIAVTEDMGKQMGATHWEVSAHADCADDHLWLQGLVVKDGSRQHKDVLQALQRPNCRHSIMPFWPGMSKKTDWGLPSKAKIKAQYALEQRENTEKNQRRKARMQQIVDRQALTKFGVASQFESQTITKVEKALSTQPQETLVVFDRSGKAIIDLAGSKNSVIIDPITMNLIEKGGYTITHNHPSSGGSFSPADLATIAKTNSLEMRAVDDEWVYIVRPDGQWGNPSEISKKHNENIDWAYTEIANRPDFAELSKRGNTTVFREALHMAMEKTAAEFGLKYTRKKRK